jgi:hypothetical protein
MMVNELFSRAGAALDGLRLSFRLFGGGDALCLRIGSSAGGALPGLHGSGLSHTLCYSHTQWNLGVGMDLTGDTKPTIARGIFAAHLQYGLPSRRPLLPTHEVRDN